MHHYLQVQKHHQQLEDINRLMETSILADVFMQLSCHGCHGIQCFKHCDINEKRHLARHLFATQLLLFIYISIAYIQYSHTFFNSKQIDILKEKKDNKILMMWIIELFMDLDKMVDPRNS